MVIEKEGANPVQAAELLKEAAQKLFGGKFETIVSDCDFAYADYYLSACHVKTKTPTGQYAMAWLNQKA